MGIGNTGGQVAARAHERLGIPVVAMNSSDKDLETLGEDIPRIKIGDKNGIAQGAGKDRATAKKYLKESLVKVLSDEYIVDFVSNLEVLFVVGSTGGGTGSGTAPVTTSILKHQFVETKIILVGVLPTDSEALSSHVNTLEYLNELYSEMADQTYMLYDNDKLAKMPSYQMMQKVNDEIVSDINVLRLFYNTATRYDSIDEKDMGRLISPPGRVMVSRLEGIKEKDCDTKSIEDMLIENIKTNCHVESQRDGRVAASGIITNLSESLSESFDNHIPNVRKFTGEPVHDFNHIYINPDRKMDNNVFLILSGLSPINDRVNKISDRIQSIEDAQKEIDEENALSAMNLGQLSSKISEKKEEQAEADVDVTAIFKQFGM